MPTDNLPHAVQVSGKITMSDGSEVEFISLPNSSMRWAIDGMKKRHTHSVNITTALEAELRAEKHDLEQQLAKKLQKKEGQE